MPYMMTEAAKGAEAATSLAKSYAQYQTVQQDAANESKLLQLQTTMLQTQVQSDEDMAGALAANTKKLQEQGKQSGKQPSQESIFEATINDLNSRGTSSAMKAALKLQDVYEKGQNLQTAAQARKEKIEDAQMDRASKILDYWAPQVTPENAQSIVGQVLNDQAIPEEYRKRAMQGLQQGMPPQQILQGMRQALQSRQSQVATAKLAQNQEKIDQGWKKLEDNRLNAQERLNSTLARLSLLREATEIKRDKQSFESDRIALSSVNNIINSSGSKEDQKQLAELQANVTKAKNRQKENPLLSTRQGLQDDVDAAETALKEFQVEQQFDKAKKIRAKALGVSPEIATKLQSMADALENGLEVKDGATPKQEKTSAADFNSKWASLKPGQTLVGPDGKTYTKGK